MSFKDQGFSAYFQQYVSLVEEEDVILALKKSLQEAESFLNLIPEKKKDYAYADGKWSIAEMLVHLLDSELIFNYRALRFSRNDTVDLLGFDHELFAKASEANNRSIAGITSDFIFARKNSLALFRSFSEGQLQKRGTANGMSLNVTTLGYLICGHQKHHFNVLQNEYL